jgi:hypothetical protein
MCKCLISNKKLQHFLRTLNFSAIEKYSVCYVCEKSIKSNSSITQIMFIKYISNLDAIIKY